jgi:hypothetical protein
MSEVVIRVIRTGGFAGLTEAWSVRGSRELWMPLVDACSWRGIPPDPLSGDRFRWRIVVTAPGLRRSATVPDAALTGAWRELVSRVQDA